MMSYKHNNLMAIRQTYWHEQSARTVQEKQILQHLLIQYHVIPQASLDDAKYLFFHLPSCIILKGYALGFVHQQVQSMMIQFIQKNKADLAQKIPFKVPFQL